MPACTTSPRSCWRTPISPPTPPSTRSVPSARRTPPGPSGPHPRGTHRRSAHRHVREGRPDHRHQRGRGRQPHRSHPRQPGKHRPGRDRRLRALHSRPEPSSSPRPSHTDCSLEIGCGAVPRSGNSSTYHRENLASAGSRTPARKAIGVIAERVLEEDSGRQAACFGGVIVDHSADPVQGGARGNQPRLWGRRCSARSPGRSTPICSAVTICSIAVSVSVRGEAVHRPLVPDQ